MLYLYKETPGSYFIDKFWSIRRKIRYQFYLDGNKQQIMDEVCVVGPDDLRNNYRNLRIFRGTKCFSLTSCRKNLVMSIPNQIILCNYFEDLLVWLYDQDVFLYVPGIWMNTLLNLFRNVPSIFLNFFPVWFFIVLLAKSSKWRKYTYNNYHKQLP